MRSCKHFVVGKLTDATGKIPTAFVNEFNRLARVVYGILLESSDPNSDNSTKAPRPCSKEFPLYPTIEQYSISLPWADEYYCHNVELDRTDWEKSGEHTVPDQYLKPLTKEYAEKVGMRKLTCEDCAKFAEMAEAASKE